MFRRTCIIFVCLILALLVKNRNGCHLISLGHQLLWSSPEVWGSAVSVCRLGRAVSETRTVQQSWENHQNCTQSKKRHAHYYCLYLIVTWHAHAFVNYTCTLIMWSSCDLHVHVPPIYFLLIRGHGIEGHDREGEVSATAGEGEREWGEIQWVNPGAGAGQGHAGQVLTETGSIPSHTQAGTCILYMYTYTRVWDSLDWTVRSMKTNCQS